MPDGSVPLLIALITLILLSGFFSATETAYSCANRIKLRANVSSGKKRAEKILKLAENNYDKLLSTILIGNNIVNITAATIATLFFAKIITTATIDSNVISTIVMSVIVLIFGEITPKFIAKTYPEKLSHLFYPVIIFFYYLFYPLNILASLWKKLIGKIFKLNPDDVITEEEIMTVVEEAEEDGTLRKDETKLIRSVIEFDDLDVGDILVPRVNMIAVGSDWDINRIKSVFDNEGYSRLPVFKDNIDTIIGIIHEKDFFSLYLSGEINIESIITPAYFTTEHTKISKLLKILQKRKTHIAVVVDEYGGTLGLVTLEDILEELVGEIWDEHDEKFDCFTKLEKDTYSVLGNTPLNEFFEFFNLEGQENFEANTLSGFIIERLGEIPKTGTTVSYENVTIQITQATVKKVQLVNVKINQFV